MRLFLSYAQPDQSFRDQLVKHLSQLKHDRILDAPALSSIVEGKGTLILNGKLDRSRIEYSL